MTTPESTPRAALNTRLSEIIDYLDDVRAKLEAFVSATPSSQHVRRPEPDSWTIAEVLEHLGLIEDSVGRLISSMAKQLRTDNAHETASTSMLGALDEFGLPGVQRKLVAPEPYRPTGTLSTDEALERLRTIRARVLEAVHKSNGLDLTKTAFPHPFFGPLNGYQWLLLIGQHEMRHLNQMKDSLHKLMTEPTVSASAASQASQ